MNKTLELMQALALAKALIDAGSTFIPQVLDLLSALKLSGELTPEQEAYAHELYLAACARLDNPQLPEWEQIR